MIDLDKFPEIEVKPRYAPCHKCKKPVDMSKIYATVFIDEEGIKEVIYHIECFHEDYTPEDLEEFKV